MRLVQIHRAETLRVKRFEPSAGRLYKRRIAGEQSDQTYFPLIEYVYAKVSEVRKKILARVEDRSATGQKVVDNLPTDFGGTPPEEGKKSGGQPDFTDM